MGGAYQLADTEIDRQCESRQLTGSGLECPPTGVPAKTVCCTSSDSRLDDTCDILPST